MLILVLNDVDDELSRVKKFYHGINLLQVRVSSDRRWADIKSALSKRKINVQHITHVISDVHMPTPTVARRLILEMREDGFLPPIILVSADCENRKIPTELLGPDALGEASTYRRNNLPRSEELERVRAFESKPLLPSESLRERANTLRSGILTPFVLLYLGLQTVAQDKNGKSNKLSPEEIESCRKGIALLKNKKFEIEKALCEMMGVPHPVKGDCPEPLTQLQKWVDDNSSKVGRLFEQAVKGEFERFTQEKLNGVLTVIEKLSGIVNRAVDYGEWVKKNSDLHHFLDNAVPRLSGYPEMLDEEGCRSVERNLKRLDSTLASCLAPDSGEFWSDEIKEAAKSALSMIGKIRKALQQGQSGQGAFSRKSALLDALDQVARLTLPRMPRPEAK